MRIAHTLFITHQGFEMKHEPNPAIALQLHFTRLVDRVAELALLRGTESRPHHDPEL